MNASLKIGWSNFALERHVGPRAALRFLGAPGVLLSLVERYWAKRAPGSGRSGLDLVVVVPILEPDIAGLFSGGWIPVEAATDLRTEVTRRQPHEDPYLVTTGLGVPLPVSFAKVVLYSAATLLENDGERSGDFDWEIVALVAGPWENEPMMPLTMARNFLQKPGGTYAPYSAAQLAESIYFWSQFVAARPQ